MSLILPPELEQFRGRLESMNKNQQPKVIYTGDNNPNLGYKDKDENFHPAGSDQDAAWTKLKLGTAVGQLVYEFGQRGIKEGVCRRVGMQMYIGNPQMPLNLFLGTMRTQLESYYNEHKEEIETASANEKEFEELVSGKNKEDSSRSENTQKTTSIKLIKLDGGIIFNMDDFENSIGGKLKLKSQKKAIKLTDKQLEELTKQL